MKAKEMTEPKLKPHEWVMMKNPYTKADSKALIELLTEPKDDWRLIIQALAWNGGG